jgi:bifunctional UDP-N-acetylglucosamine pyrophosphorylase/glucosamine-1-phosphate N-acetyltransferase
MSTGPLSAIVLAAGEGTRMRSDRPKPLHLLCGRPMLRYVLDALGTSELDRVVIVVGHHAERVTKRLQDDGPDLLISFVEQEVQRGTGDAVSVGLTGFPDDPLDEDDGDVIVLPGDTPLLRPETIAALVALHRERDAACTVLSADVEDPTGYGRVVRGKEDKVLRIVEERDASDDEKQITEINTSIYCFRRSVLAPALRRTSPANAQGGYYLAAAAEAVLRRRTADRWLRAGVTMLDPERISLDTTVRLGQDVTLFPGTLLQGETVIGDHAEIGPNTRLVDCVVGADTRLEQVVGRDAEVGDDAVVGPFAVLEPGSHVPSGARTGPFYTAAADD